MSTTLPPNVTVPPGLAPTPAPGGEPPGSGGGLLAIPGAVGAAVLDIAEQIGGIGVLTGRIVRRFFPPRIDRYELVRNLHKMGVLSVAIVAATATFTGAIMVIQAAPMAQRFGATDVVPWGAGFAILREVGPLLIALMFNGRVGANNTAELGTMVVTEQIDALRALAIDPIAYLVIPRCIAMVITIFLLTILGDAVAIAGAMFASKLLLGMDPRTFMNAFLALLDERDLYVGLIKSLIFGTMIAITSCHFGLSVKGGAPGVGRGVNAAVVAAASGVFVLDFFSTFLIG